MAVAVHGSQLSWQDVLKIEISNQAADLVFFPRFAYKAVVLPKELSQRVCAQYLNNIKRIAQFRLDCLKAEDTCDCWQDFTATAVSEGERSWHPKKGELSFLSEQMELLKKWIQDPDSLLPVPSGWQSSSSKAKWLCSSKKEKRADLPS